MKIKIISIIMLAILIFPAVSADVIIPGYHPISVINKITNINEFPNYVFVHGPSLEKEGSPGIGMCPLQLVEEDGNIPGAYKFCDLSVFAIKKDKWDIEKAEKFISDSKSESTLEEYQEFMNSIGAKEVIKNIRTYKEVPDSSSVTEEVNTYAIDLEKVKIEPDNVKKEVQYWRTIIYILISLVALITIIMIIIRRKNE